MKPRIGVVITLGVLALVGLTSQLWLRQLKFFQVRSVELVGVKHLDREGVLGALELEPNHNLFSDLDVIERRVAAVPGIVGVQVARRLPATLRISVTEAEPVAFVSGPEGFVALDSEARPLPYDPTGGELDLPIVERASRPLVRMLARIRTARREFYNDVGGVRFGAGEITILEFAESRAVFSGSPSTDELLRVAAVRRHLIREGSRLNELDARFSGWVVARRVSG